MDDIIRQINELRQKLKEDILKYEHNLGLYTGQIIANTLTEEAHSAISDFYSSYHPDTESYIRHYNFWNSYRKIHRNQGGKRIVGVELMISNIPDVYTGRESSPQDVFYRVYLGAHGLASYQGKIPFFSPSPFMRLYKKRKEIIENQKKYSDMGSQKARKDKYNLLFK